MMETLWHQRLPTAAQPCEQTPNHRDCTRQTGVSFYYVNLISIFIFKLDMKTGRSIGPRPPPSHGRGYLAKGSQGIQTLDRALETL